DHEVALCGDLLKALEHRGEQLRLALGIGARVERGPPLATHDDLRAGLAFRLEKDGIHMHRGFYSCRTRLQHLGASDLSSVRSRAGIVRHVLRLERRHAQSTIRKGTAE